ncbi:unnamed protein product [Rotaria socialis]|uniref:Uncharacterized protein n=1 Tax=Rotaria socialis TaxID=392032 RepID=A0A817YHL3_9BILA|nr:unnamed protein product [Rotaria socialis]CAF4468601.1 unnamed protein product [Rotaria socialis]
MISGKIAKQPTKMLIDSGASLTLINSSLFNRLPYHIRQRVEYQTGNLQLHLARDVPRPRQNRESRSRWSRSRSVSVSVSICLGLGLDLSRSRSSRSRSQFDLSYF